MELPRDSRILVWDDEVTCRVIRGARRPWTADIDMVAYGSSQAGPPLPAQSKFLDAAYILGRMRDLVDRKVEFAGSAGQVLGFLG